MIGSRMFLGVTLALLVGIAPADAQHRGGSHDIRITAPGYRAMEFDADIVSGEVVPYQGTLER